MTTNNGGSAFPHDEYRHPQQKNAVYVPSVGMTLRDWFAGMALQNITFQTFKDGQKIQTSINEVAKYVYEVADAMIAARGEVK